MILLIRKSAIQKQMKHASFKFHYDSINSFRIELRTTTTRRFKFHYDSINSLTDRNVAIYRKDLNSIMILLIHESLN